VRHLPARREQLEEVVELSVDVAADGDGAVDRLDVGLLDEDLLDLRGGLVEVVDEVFLRPRERSVRSKEKKKTNRRRSQKNKKPLAYHLAQRLELVLLEVLALPQALYPLVQVRRGHGGVEREEREEGRGED
jgi:hypothetical protein